MTLAPRFRQGMKAAIPIWIAFVPSSIAWGIAAQAHGLRLDEIVLMSAWVYSGPAQFAVLDPLATGKSSLQVLIAGTLMNLRFLPMSAALAPYFAGTRRFKLFLSCHFVSASSFIVSYLQFQKERESGPPSGYAVALGVPRGFDEALKFILPGYFAGLLMVEMRGWTMRLVCLASLLLAVPAAAINPGWGSITAAAAIATLGWGVEQWKQRVS
jgi:predicted branched-subunit amino acid permease